MPSPQTIRQYARVEANFREWLGYEKKTLPVDHATIAQYLKDVARERGPTAVGFHASAIAYLYRHKLRVVLDIKHPLIEEVLRGARRATRRRREGVGE